MEIQKVVNSLNDSDDDFPKVATKSGMLLMSKIIKNMVKEIKMIPALNFKQN